MFGIQGNATASADSSSGSGSGEAGVPETPLAMQRALALIDACKAAFGDIASAFIEDFAGKFQIRLQAMETDLKHAEVVRLLQVCDQDELDAAAGSDLVRLVAGEGCQSYYKNFKRLGKIRTGHNSLREAACKGSSP